jgi:hypothetical protein
VNLLSEKEPASEKATDTPADPDSQTTGEHGSGKKNFLWWLWVFVSEKVVFYVIDKVQIWEFSQRKY